MLITIVIITATLAFMCPIARADDKNDFYRQTDSGVWVGIPQPCQDYDSIYAGYPVFSAKCNNQYGNQCQNTAFNLTFCNFGMVGPNPGIYLVDDDGTLRCNDGYQSWVPGGLWIARCTPVSYDPSTKVLQARCAADSYNCPDYLTEIDTSICQPDSIYNDLGVLKCVKKDIYVQTDSGVWVGIPQPDCQDYDSIYAGYPVFSAKCNYNYVNNKYGDQCQNTAFNLTFCNFAMVGPNRWISLTVVHGILRCAIGYQGWVPGGSWVNSCTPVSYDPSTKILQARCAYEGWCQDDLRVFDTSICQPGSVYNDGGYLKCSPMPLASYVPPPPFPRPPLPSPPRICSLHSDCPDIRTSMKDDRFCCGPHGLCVPQPWKPNTNPSSDQMIIWLGCPNLPPPSPPQCYQHSDCPDIRTSNKDDRFCCGTNGACTPQPWKLNTNPNSDRMIIWLGCDNTKSPPPSPAPRRSPPPRRLANPSGSKASVKETRKRRQKKDRKRKGQY